jgi:hypothetical protein
MQRVRVKEGMTIAYVVGDGPGAVLRDLARHMGFGAVYTFRGIASAERQAAAAPLVYFLFSAVDDLRKLKPITEAIRASQVQRIRFAPMIYLSKSPSLDTIKACINLGFDDVITRPFTLNRISQRLQRQVGHTLVYYETPTYFGPDRRGRLKHEEGHSKRGTGGQYRRLEITRSPVAGINVLSDETHVVL